MNVYDKILSLRHEIAAAAQAIYNEAYDDPDLGTGGICDQINDAIQSILATEGLEFTDGGHDGCDHDWTIVFDGDDCYNLDIPYSVYEEGGGYNWTLFRNVVFTADDVEIYLIKGLSRSEVECVTD